MPAFDLDAYFARVDHRDPKAVDIERYFTEDELKPRARPPAPVPKQPQREKGTSIKNYTVAKKVHFNNVKGT